MKIQPSYTPADAQEPIVGEAPLVGVNVSLTPENKLEFVKAITTAIQPEEAEYVADIKGIIDDCEECGCTDQECEDIIYVSKIMAFADKFRLLHWAAKNHSSHVVVDDFCKAIEDYKDAIAENIQAIIGQFKADEILFHEIKLPIGDNPLDIINQLKQVVVNWFNSTKDDMAYEGCRNSTSSFIEMIYKTIYLLRLCK